MLNKDLWQTVAIYTGLGFLTTYCSYKLTHCNKLHIVTRRKKTTFVKYLGVLLDEHITWSPQILYI